MPLALPPRLTRTERRPSLTSAPAQMLSYSPPPVRAGRGSADGGRIPFNRM
jgi:hypothetical protein